MIYVRQRKFILYVPYLCIKEYRYCPINQQMHINKIYLLFADMFWLLL